MADSKRKHQGETEEQRILSSYRNRLGGHQYFTYEDPAHLSRLHERFQNTLHLLKTNGFHSFMGKKILDVGCGDGNMLRQFLQWGALPEHLAGIDLRPEPIEKAKNINPNLDLRCGSATKLSFPDANFDLVCQYTVFTSILDSGMKRKIAAEMDRVLKPGGAVLWYDFFYNNPTNQDVQGVKKTEIKALFPHYRHHFRKITLAPPIARRIPEALLPIFYPLLSAIPILRTHYLAVLIKR